jgi:hypothetical protein
MRSRFVSSGIENLSGFAEPASFEIEVGRVAHAQRSEVD